METIPLKRSLNLRKKEYTSHPITRLTLFMHAFYHTPIENLLKDPVHSITT